MKAEIDKLDINKLVDVSPNLSNLKVKVDDLDVGKLKSVSLDLKKSIDVVKNDVVKNINFYTQDKSK